MGTTGIDLSTYYITQNIYFFFYFFFIFKKGTRSTRKPLQTTKQGVSQRASGVPVAYPMCSSRLFRTSKRTSSKWRSTVSRRHYQLIRMNDGNSAIQVVCIDDWCGLIIFLNSTVNFGHLCLV